jgi:DNA-binding transcriptional LysR family regulator
VDLTHLQAFARIAREGSFSRAARALDITQPTISGRVAALERELGGPLFIRAGRHIRLSEMGDSFLPYAERALGVLSEGSEAARLAREGQRGRVRIGTIHSLAGGFVASAVARFHAERPRASVYVRSAHADQVIEMLHDGVAQLGLVVAPHFDAGLSTLLHLRESVALVASPQHPLAARPRAGVAEVRELARPFFVLRWGPSVEALLARLTGGEEPSMEIPSVAARQLLLRGMGAALFTRALIEDDLAAGRLVEITLADEGPVYRDSALVRLADGRPLPAVTLAFLDVLHEEARKSGVQVHA